MKLKKNVCENKLESPYSLTVPNKKISCLENQNNLLASFSLLT